MKNKKLVHLLPCLTAGLGMMLAIGQASAESAANPVSGQPQVRAKKEATPLKGPGDQVLPLSPPLAKSYFLGVQHVEGVASPLQSPLLDPAPKEFIPGKTGLDALFGFSTLPVVSAASNTPWPDVKPVEMIGFRDAAKNAMDFSREIKAAESRVEQADSQASQAFGNLLPNMVGRYADGTERSSPASNFYPGTSTPKLHDNHHRNDNSVTLKQPIVDLASFGDWQRRKRVVESKEASLLGTRGDEYVSLVQSYLGLVSAKLQAGLAREYEKQLNDFLEYIAQRATAGASSEADAQRVRARALTARASRMEQDAAQEAALVEFMRLTNVVPKALRLPRYEDLHVQFPDTIDKAIELGMEQNPEVLALKSDLEAAEWDKLAAKGRYLPRVDIELTDQKTTNAGGSDIGVQHDTRAMLVLSWNILSGGSDYHYNKERESRKEEARWKLDDQRRKLVQGLTAQYAQLDSARGRLASGYKELAAITGAARAMSERMLAGNTSLLDLLDVLERVYQTRSRLVTLHVQEISSAAQVGRYLGQPKEVTDSSGEVRREGEF